MRTWVWSITPRGSIVRTSLPISELSRCASASPASASSSRPWISRSSPVAQRTMSVVIGSSSGRSATVGTIQPPLGLVEPAQPHERDPADRQRRGDDRLLAPSERFGPRDRLLGVVDPVEDRASRVRPGDPEMGEAADLEVRAFRLLCQGQSLLEVAARLVGSQRPQLGDADVHYGRGAVVGYASDVACRLGRQRRLHLALCLERGREVDAAARQPQLRAGYPQVEAPAPLLGNGLGEPLGHLDVRLGLVGSPREQARARRARSQAQRPLPPPPQEIVASSPPTVSSRPSRIRLM